MPRIVSFLGACVAFSTFAPAAFAQAGSSGGAPPRPPQLVMDSLVPGPKGCQIGAVIRNQGGPIPASSGPYTVEFFDKRDRSLGTTRLDQQPEFDALRPANGYRVMHALGTTRMEINESMTYRAVLRGPSGTIVTDRAERKDDAQCKRDIAIKSLSLTPACTAKVVLKNVGKTALPPSSFSLDDDAAGVVFLGREIDDLVLPLLRLGELDPNRQLMFPGRELEYEEPAQFRAYKELDYWIVDDTKVNRADKEKEKVKGACAGTPPKPKYDLAIVGHSVDQKCWVTVTIKNIGTEPVPDVPVSLQSYHDGDPAGGYSVAAAGLAPGKTIERSIGMQDTKKPVDFEMILRHSHNPKREIKDGNPGNNSKVVRKYSCPKKP